MEPLHMQAITEKYNITPSAGLLLYPYDKEDDDKYHDPATEMEDDDHGCDVFTKRGLMNIGGLIFITVGILVLFIGYPVLSVTTLRIPHLFAGFFLSFFFRFFSLPFFSFVFVFFAPAVYRLIVRTWTLKIGHLCGIPLRRVRSPIASEASVWIPRNC